MWRMPGGALTCEYLYLARDLTVGAPRREAREEDMTLHWMPLDEAVELCQSGRITEASTLTAILLTVRHLAAEPGRHGTGAPWRMSS
jgi:ADP-ribose pyrophosphatase